MTVLNKDVRNKGENGTYMRWIASNMMNIEIRIKKIPLANPDNVSMRP
jgi:hypothetical protein